MKFITVLVIMVITIEMSIQQQKKQTILELFPDYRSLTKTVRMGKYFDFR